MLDPLYDDRKSSFHCLSGDGKLSLAGKLAYIGFVTLEFQLNRDRSLNWPVEYYSPELNVERLTYTFGDHLLTVSPSRALCYDFLLHHARTFLGNRPAVIDLGCGNGSYSRHLRKLVEFASYQGLDILRRSDWEKHAADDVAFATAVLGKDVIDVDGRNAVFSQSVLEHVEHDREIFRRFRSTGPVTLKHLHLMPATRSWYDYRFHGYRRYGPVELNRLLNDPGFFNVRIFALGNWLSRTYYRPLKGRRAKFGDVGVKGRKALESYNKSLSPLENLARRRDELIATEISDVSFFAIAFEQRLG
ncbi:MAG: class I SAM-dependent methyltransferase [Hyphomicrobiales bacterium]|nr:class I SAM-dependent methyltransferase [Hyphomicrobiales bacterium]